VLLVGPPGRRVAGRGRQGLYPEEKRQGIILQRPARNNVRTRRENRQAGYLGEAPFRLFSKK
jgi:hypothetical protein